MNEDKLTSVASQQGKFSSTTSRGRDDLPDTETSQQPRRESLLNLRKIEHLVVLMMENHSFDSMLGYLTLEKRRNDVDGLSTGMFNEFDGDRFGPVHLEETTFRPGPLHADVDVAEQI